MAEDRTAEREIASDLLAGATARLVRTVDGFHGDDWATPSLLPGWSRAHVVAHLALNAEGMARALAGLVADDKDEESRTMYDSDEQRDADIRELATAPTGDIRDRLMAGGTVLADAITAVPRDAWGIRVERTPGGRQIRADAFPGMRLRELEIHHADLGTGYTPSDWSEEFAIHLLDAMTKRLDPAEPFEVRPLDVDRVWTLGPHGGQAPVVTGPAADIGWWLTGRPPSESVSCSRGGLPLIEDW